jgi:hypothetical protein
MTIAQNSQTFVLDTSGLDKLIRESPQKVADVVSKTAFRILADARKVTPRDPARPPKDPDAYKPSGALRANSDVVKQDAKGLTQNVEYYQEYALAQELGNPAVNLPARPYLTPATEQNAKKFVEDLGKVLNE